MTDEQARAMALMKEYAPGLAEFETLKNNSQIDMGDMKSRDLGNMLSGELVNLGKEIANELYPDVDYGDLPSKTLPNLGKIAVEEAEK